MPITYLDQYEVVNVKESLEYLKAIETLVGSLPYYEGSLQYQIERLEATLKSYLP